MKKQLSPCIEELDLSLVEYRLMTKLGWAKDRTANAVQGYREFLQQVKDAGKGAYHRPPSDDVDEVWHAHILHTKQYEADCNAIFGYFFNHHPDKPKKAKDDSTSSCGGDVCIIDAGSDQPVGLWQTICSWFDFGCGADADGDRADAGCGGDGGGDAGCGGGCGGD